ncbi:hypothetical protein ACH5RR_022293 [Cinchona calisaya]|uniref:hAT-like transposase RNase-H fold domain-containing protein n=1 Tax=Cinchona calisaya TaxID=153742 RepID=A0ABD2Z7D0_9GENT
MVGAGSKAEAEWKLSSTGDNTDTSATSPAGPNASTMMKPPKNVGTSKDPHFSNDSKLGATNVVNEEEIVSESDKRSSRVRGLPTESDWEYAHNLLLFLKVFCETIERLSGSHYITGNQYMIEIYAIGFLLTSLIEGSDMGVSMMASNKKKKYDKYWGNINKLNILLFIVVVLNPRFKLKSRLRQALASRDGMELAAKLKAKQEEFQSKYWWAAPINELNLKQLKELKKKLEGLQVDLDNYKRKEMADANGSAAPSGSRAGN